MEKVFKTQENSKVVDYLLQKIWEELVIPLIDKRTEILEQHNNSMDAFLRPEVVALDSKIDLIDVNLRTLEKFNRNRLKNV